MYFTDNFLFLFIRHGLPGAALVPVPAGPAILSSWVMCVLPGSRSAPAVLRGFLLPVDLLSFFSLSIAGFWPIRGGMSCSRAGSCWLCEDDFEGLVRPSEVST